MDIYPAVPNRAASRVIISKNDYMVLMKSRTTVTHRRRLMLKVMLTHHQFYLNCD